MIQLIYGGSGSGKSAFAEERVVDCNHSKRFYIATMQVYGEEGRKKVERHRQLRAGKGFMTIEQPRDIDLSIAAMKNAIKESDEPEPKETVALLECVSNLVANEMFCEGEQRPEELVVEKVVRNLRELSGSVKHLVIVSNNIFEDGIAYDESTRAYMRVLGSINHALADMADQVYEVVVGIPVRVK